MTNFHKKPLNICVHIYKCLFINDIQNSSTKHPNACSILPTVYHMENGKASPCTVYQMHKIAKYHINYRKWKTST